MNASRSWRYSAITLFIICAFALIMNSNHVSAQTPDWSFRILEAQVYLPVAVRGAMPAVPDPATCQLRLQQWEQIHGPDGPPCNCGCPTPTPTATWCPPTEPPPTSTPSCPAGLDVVLVLDGSGSIVTDDFNLVQNFATDLVTRLDVSEAGAHIGVVQFSDRSGSSTARVEVPLNGDRTRLEAGIESMDQLMGLTFLAPGLTLAVKELDLSGRTNVPSVVIVMSDGNLSDEADAVTIAQILKTEGSRIFTLGIEPDIDQSQLRAIASLPWSEHVLLVDDFDMLSSILAGLVVNVCATSTPTGTSEPPPDPTPTSHPIYASSGRVIRRDTYCGNQVLYRYALINCAGDVRVLSCTDTICDPYVNLWVTISWTDHDDCGLGTPPFWAPIVSSIAHSDPDPCPQQPTATATSTSTPTATPGARCDWMHFDWTTLGAPEQCRWFDSQGLSVRFNIEKRILLPNGVTDFVENSFYLMEGYTGYIVGEGDFTLYCEGFSEARVRQDMEAHMDGRRRDPNFIRDGKTIGEVTVAEARAWGILRDTCNGVTVCEKMVERDRRDPRQGTWVRWGDMNTFGLCEHWRNWGNDQHLYVLLLEPGQVYDIHGGGNWFSTACEYEARNEFARVSAIRIPITINDLVRSGLARCVVGSRDCPVLLNAGDVPIPR